jgi:hypothetical protein
VATGPAAQPPEPPPGGERGRGRRTLALVLAGLVVLAAAVGVPLALTHGGTSAPTGRTASAQRLTSLSGQLAQLADSVRATDPARAARLSLAAYRIAPSAPAAQAVVASFAARSWAALPGPGATYTGAALSADGRLAAATDSAGHLRLWSLADPDHPTLAADVDTGTATLSGARFLPAAALVTGGLTGQTWALDNPAAPRRAATITGRTTPPLRLALSGDGTLLATAGQDRAVELWDVHDPADPKPVRFLLATGIVADIALSSDGRTLAAAGVSGAVTLWDIADPRNPAELGQASGHVGPVNAVSFLPSGAAMVTGGDDQTVRLWSLADRAHPTQVAELTGHRAAVEAVVPVGGGWLATGDATGTVLGWALGPGPAAGASPAPVVLASGPSRPGLAADGAGTELLSVPAGGPPGTPRLASTDPARLVTIACRDAANRISAAEWRAIITDLAYEDPCAG